MKKRLFTLALASFILFLAACASGNGGSAFDKSGGSSGTDMSAQANGAPEPAAQNEGSLSDGKGGAGTIGAVPTAAQSQDKIIYSADAGIETKEYEKTIDGVSKLIEEYGGFLQSSSIGGADYGSVGGRYAQFGIRIPSDRFNELTNNLSVLGNVSYCRTYAQNVTSEFVDLQARLDSYKIQEERLLTMLQKAVSLEDMLAIETKLTEVRYNIEMYTTQLNNLENQVSYSTVSISIEEVVDYSPDNSVNQSFLSRMKEAFSSGISGLINVLQAIVLFVVCFWYVFAAVAAATVVFVKRRKKINKAKAEQEVQTK